MQKLLHYIKNPEFRSFLIFFLTALFGAGVNFLSQIPYKGMFLNLGFDNNSSYPLSVFFSYLTATVVSFIPQKIFAFSAKESGNTKRETIKYVVIALTGLGIQTLISYFAFNFITKPMLPTTSLTVQEKVAHLIGMSFSFFANFFGHKFLTFRSTGIYDKFKTRG